MSFVGIPRRANRKGDERCYGRVCLTFRRAAQATRFMNLKPLIFKDLGKKPRLGWKDSNLRMAVPKTAALPLGDTPAYP